MARSAAQFFGFLAVVAGFAVLGTPGPRGYFYWMAAGLCLSATAGLVHELLYIRFRNQHDAESLDFWRDHYGRIGPPAYYLALAGLVAGLAALVVGVATARWGVVGFTQSPLFACALVINALFGKLHP